MPQNAGTGFLSSHAEGPEKTSWHSETVPHSLTRGCLCLRGTSLLVSGLAFLPRDRCAPSGSLCVSCQHLVWGCPTENGNFLHSNTGLIQWCNRWCKHPHILIWTSLWLLSDTKQTAQGCQCDKPGGC